MREPLPAHKRAEILVRSWRWPWGADTTRSPGRSPTRPGSRSRQPGSRPSAPCRPTPSPRSRPASSPARWCRWTPPRPARASSASRSAGRSGSSARSRRSTSRSTSSRTSSPRRSRPAARWCSSRRAPTPLSALLLAELEDEAGLPPGWLNVVVGPSAEIGDVLVEDERVKAITFTGSSGVGWGLKERAPKKKVSLELGNATPVIVAADADVDDGRDGDGRERVLLRGPELHLGAAHLRRAPGVRRGSSSAFLPQVEALKVGDPGRRGDRRRPGDRRGRARADPRLDRGGA